MTCFDVNLATGWGLMRHKGFHCHRWPESKKPDPLAKARFKAEVMKNPKAGAFKLKVTQILHLCKKHSCHVNKCKANLWLFTPHPRLGIRLERRSLTACVTYMAFSSTATGFGTIAS
jgi:hypothetical protein